MNLFGHPTDLNRQFIARPDAAKEDILYNSSPYTSFWVRRKYSYTCSALKNNQRTVQRTDQKTMPIPTISTQFAKSSKAEFAKRILSALGFNAFQAETMH